MKFAALLRKPMAVCAAAVLATLAGAASAVEFRSSDTHNVSFVKFVFLKIGDLCFF